MIWGLVSIIPFVVDLQYPYMEKVLILIPSRSSTARLEKLPTPNRKKSYSDHCIFQATVDGSEIRLYNQLRER